MGETKIVTSQETFERIQCGQCGVNFFMPSWFARARREDKKTWFCPSGHGRQWAGDNEADRLRRELQRQKQQNARLADEAREAEAARALAFRQASAARGQVTRLKNRAANGVCPCCNRSFSDLRRHMATKHPAFIAEEIVHGAPKH